MTIDEFTSEFALILDMNASDLRPETLLNSIEAWDSVAYLTAMVLIDEKLGITLRPELISRAEKFGDILDAVKSELN